VIERAIDILFPPQCAACDRVGSGLCADCAPPPGAAVAFALNGLPCAALGPYDGALRTAVLACKHGRRDVVETLARLIAARFGLRLAELRSTLVPVPTTRARRKERGFDQGVLLATGIARRLGIPVAAVLEHVAGHPQHGRNRAARLDTANRFRCLDVRAVAGQTVVIVDDVATTGATLRDAAATLAHAGAHLLGALVVARADDERIGSQSSRVLA
jgi:ComF family protein